MSGLRQKEWSSPFLGIFNSFYEYKYGTIFCGKKKHLRRGASFTQPADHRLLDPSHLQPFDELSIEARNSCLTMQNTL